MRPGGLASLLLVASLAACSHAAPTPASTTTTAPSTTSTTVVDYSVPAVIDAAYVTKVMKALDHIYGDAIRVMAHDRAVDEPFLKPLVAIYAPHEFQNIRDLWTTDVARGLPGLAANPGDPTTLVSAIVRSEQGCVLFSVKRDFSATRTGPLSSTPQRYIGLVPVDVARDPGHINPTPWRMAFDGFITSGAVPREPCRID